MKENIYDQIILFMKQSGAEVTPLKTRKIADGVGLTTYRALYHLNKLHTRALVEPDNRGRGNVIRWYLV
ncbi:FaeA-like protein [Citrobacter freundii]|nr:FaeA-like protein [Citrobacter freundii]